MSGGLALFWHESVHVEIISMNERYIDAYVRLSVNAPVWHATFVYGEPRVENRHRMWALLNSVKQVSDPPWLVVGDFNETLWQFEHFSLKQRSELQMQAFRDVVQRCDLHDLGFSGVPYTYDNRREGRSNVKVRLDYALADDGWRGLFSTAQVFHLSSPRSDHCPILVKFSSEDLHRNPVKCVHYEIYWERDPAISEVIAESWGVSGVKQDLRDINQALFRMMSDLRTWSKKKFRNVSREIEKNRKKLSELLLSNADNREIRRVSDQMNELLYREEMIWLQRSRIAWLKEGDRNTRFFHSKAVWRAKKNKITKLRDSDGTVHSTTKELERMATEYFQRLFTADPSIDHS
jgi:hypothetical protein